MKPHIKFPKTPLKRLLGMAILAGAVLVAFVGPNGTQSTGRSAQATTSDAGPDTGPGKGPIVVELFTSQSCYSCPPAEVYLSELAERPGVIALEYHVDYWDDLVYWTHGKWKDPFSSAAHTRRQREYNAAIRGQTGVYTPQMVIGGRLEAVGSRRGSVETAITQALRQQTSQVHVAISDSTARLSGSRTEQANVVFVEFLRKHTTDVKRGENHGKVLTNHNIVVDRQVMGIWSGSGIQDVVFKRTQSPSTHGCAILVQEGQTGPIIGAGLCPDG